LDGSGQIAGVAGDAATGSVYVTPWWFELQQQACLDPGESVAYHRIGAAILPLRRGRRWGVRHLVSLTSHFTAEYRPLGGPTDLSDIARFSKDALASTDVIRIDSLPYPSAIFAVLEHALEQTGWLRQSWFHFGNWYMRTAGLDSAAYLDSRPSQLRRTIRRKTRVLGRQDGRFTIVTGGDALDRALIDYEAVYAESWKPPERYPRFIPTMVRRSGSACAMSAASRWRRRSGSSAAAMPRSSSSPMTSAFARFLPALP
jgi:hypothetical protein